MASDWKRDLIEQLKNLGFAKSYGAERAKSSFGLAFFRARQKAGLTQKQLSEKLGISQPYVARLESGEANPTIGSFGGLLAVLGFRVVVDTQSLVPDLTGSGREVEGTAEQAGSGGLIVVNENVISWGDTHAASHGPSFVAFSEVGPANAGSTLHGSEGSKTGNWQLAPTIWERETAAIGGER